MYPYLVTIYQHGFCYTNRYASYGEAVCVFISILIRETPGITVELGYDDRQPGWD
ncbi:MAG TPA: hypothetical protein VGB67_04070 [Fibrella sp.]|jgi:hypothetical protein